MSSSQKNRTATIFIDYIPAELKENKDWMIVYYAKNPNNNWKLERKRIRIKKLVRISDRRRYAKRILVNLNLKLSKGWNPWIAENKTKSFHLLIDVFETFLIQTRQKVKKGDIRKDTLRSYTSIIKNIKRWLIDNQNEKLFVNDWKEQLLRDFLDEIYFVRDNSAATHNNYLTFLSLFSKWMCRKNYIIKDPSINIIKVKKTLKKRIIIPLEDRNHIFYELEKSNYNYYVLCLTCFYALIRRTEMTKLKVSDVYILNSIIYVSDEASKNRKGIPVTIPKALLTHIIKHISKADKNDWLFSADNFKPGKEPLDPKKISDTWAKYRKQLNFDARFQWYSLKDTGITNYLQLGLPTIDVRNQARHYSITQTETYIPKTILKPIDNIQNADLDF